MIHKYSSADSGLLGKRNFILQSLPLLGLSAKGTTESAHSRHNNPRVLNRSDTSFPLATK